MSFCFLNEFYRHSLCAGSFFDANFTDWLSVLILGITTVIVWKTTQATRKMNDIQEQPVLNLTADEQNTGPNTYHVLKVKNVGRAPAYNVKFSPIIGGGYKYRPRFQRNNANPVLEAGDEKELTFWVKTPNNGTEIFERILGMQFFMSRLFPPDTPHERYEELMRESAVFVMNYEGVNGRKYHSVFRLYSKLGPHMGTHALLSEFVSTGDGEHTRETARDMCRQKPTIPLFPEEENERI